MSIKFSSNLLKNIASKLLNNQRRAYPEPRKRFYKEVTLTKDGEHFEVNLDGRKLRTPNGKRFQIENETLAWAIANEWRSQKNLIKLNEMHLTALTNTVIDDPLHLTEADLIEKLLAQLEYDTVCYRDANETELIKLTNQHWNPLIDWFEKKFYVKINITDTVITPAIEPQCRINLQRSLAGYNLPTLIGLCFLNDNLKSLILTLALFYKRVPVQEAVDLSRLEQRFQMKRWGNVDWSHDVDLMSIRTRVAAGLLFALLNAERTSITMKSSRSS